MTLNFQSLITGKSIQALLVNFTGAGLGFINYALLARVFSNEDFGVWILIYTAIQLLEFLRAGIVLPSFMKFLPGSNIMFSKEIIGSAWVLSILMTVVLILILLSCLFFPYFQQTYLFRSYVFWVVSIFSSSLPFFMTYWNLQANRAFNKILLLSIMKVGGFSVILICIYFEIDLFNYQLNKSLDSILIYYFLVSSFVSVLCIIIGWSGLERLKYFTKKVFKKLFNFGKYTLGDVINHTILRASDTFIIGILMGTYSVAVYDVALKVINLFDVTLRGFMANIQPQVSENYNQKKYDAFKNLIVSNSIKLSFVFIFLGFGVFLFSDLLVTIMAGKNYSDSGIILQVLVIYCLFLPVNRLLNVSMECLGKPNINFNVSILAVILNVAGNYIGIIVFDELWVVAFTTIIITFIVFVIKYFYFNFYYRKLHPK